MKILKLVLGLVFPVLVFAKNPYQELFNKVAKCKEVFFIQKTIFEDSIETYKGILKIDKQKKKIRYFTDPPFIVIQKGKYLRIGYEGEDFQTFDVEDYPNPVLAILLHFDNLKKVFTIKSCNKTRCVLLPYPPIKDYLEKVEIFFSKGKIEKIRAEGDELGTVIIQILELKGCFNPQRK